MPPEDTSIKKSKLSQIIFCLIAALVAAIAAGSVYIWQHHELTTLKAKLEIHSMSNKANINRNIAIATPGNIINEDGITHDYTIPPVINGEVPVISRIPTKTPVVFLTIDDGISQNNNDSQLMQFYGVKASFFLVHRFISDNPSFFGSLAEQTGSLIEDHTYDHYLQTNLNLTQSQQDICTDAGYLNQQFGRYPLLFRPPGGAYDDTTRKAAANCGMQALVMWDATVNNGSLQYQSGNSLKPGDIVLMHFRTTFAEDLNAFVSAMNKSGLKTDLLENWLDPGD